MVMLNEYEDSLWDNFRILEIYSGEGCTAL